MEILTIEHSRWHEFTEDLYELIGEGCTGSHEGTIKVLKEMGGFNVGATLKYLRANGGCCCDCEVLCNVDRPKDLPFDPTYRAGRAARLD
jgi:hypothetical protein